MFCAEPLSFEKGLVIIISNMFNTQVGFIIRPFSVGSFAHSIHMFMVYTLWLVSFVCSERGPHILSMMHLGFTWPFPHCNYACRYFLRKHTFSQCIGWFQTRLNSGLIVSKSSRSKVKRLAPRKVFRSRWFGAWSSVDGAPPPWNNYSDKCSFAIIILSSLNCGTKPTPHCSYNCWLTPNHPV